MENVYYDYFTYYNSTTKMNFTKPDTDEMSLVNL